MGPLAEATDLFELQNDSVMQATQSYAKVNLQFGSAIPQQSSHQYSLPPHEDVDFHLFKLIWHG